MKENIQSIPPETPRKDAMSIEELYGFRKSYAKYPYLREIAEETLRRIQIFEELESKRSKAGEVISFVKPIRRIDYVIAIVINLLVLAFYLYGILTP